MSDDDHAATDAALSSRVRQAVADLNQAVADAAQAGVEVQVSLIEHQTVGSAFKRQLVSARLVRPIASA
ncbi:hypothetical protein ACSD7O_14065 [Methylorubrum extorquens]|uniref:hypothetical protein n=1 Tax=Methylorubrum extorquens TaxID=408 RepID=UPI003F5DF4DB